MSVQVALTFPDFAAAQAFFASMEQQSSIEVTGPKPGTYTVLPAGATPTSAPVAETGPRKPGRKKNAEPSPAPAPAAEAAPAAPVPPLDVAKGDPLPANMQPEKPAESSVDPLEVPAFLKREDPNAPPAKVWTEDEVRDVLKAVSAKHGLDAVRQLLVEVCGKSRISEVPATDYAKLAEAANKKVAA